MHKWNIKLVLRNGDIIKGKFIGPQTNSEDVANALIEGQTDHSWIGIADAKDGHNIFVNLGDVVIIDISLPDPE